jgi:hypothetical protein
MLNLQIALPDDTPEEAIQPATRRAREAAVLVLQQAGGFTIREAAAELGLTYEGYLGLLAERGLPATHDTTTPEALALLRRGMGIRERPQ